MAFRYSVFSTFAFVARVSTIIDVKALTRRILYAVSVFTNCKTSSKQLKREFNKAVELQSFGSQNGLCYYKRQGKGSLVEILLWPTADILQIKKLTQKKNKVALN